LDVLCDEFATGPGKTDVLRKSREAFHSNAASLAQVHSSSPAGVSSVSLRQTMISGVLTEQAAVIRDIVGA
jgi:hypothetical protein